MKKHMLSRKKRTILAALSTELERYWSDIGDGLLKLNEEYSEQIMRQAGKTTMTYELYRSRERQIVDGATRPSVKRLNRLVASNRIK